MLANLLNDIRYSLHGFALRPMFAAVVVLTLALGIGVNVAVFSLYDQIMLRELPVNRPGELVKLVSPGPRLRQSSSVTSRARTTRRSAIRCSATSRLRPQPYLDLAASWIATGRRSAMTGASVRGLAVLVSGGYFAALGVGPALGRVLGEQDVVGAQPASRHVVVRLLDDGLRRRPGRDRQDARSSAASPLEIVGVAPRGFVRHDTWREPEGVRALHARMVSRTLNCRAVDPRGSDSSLTFMCSAGCSPGVRSREAQSRG